MTHWIVPSNNNFFRLDDSLKGRNKIFWRQMNRFEVGDIIYIYEHRGTVPLCSETLMCKLNYRTKTT